MAVILIGYHRFTSKKNVECCVASVVKDLSPRDKSFGYVGQKTEEIFMPDGYIDLLKPEDIGHELILDYDMSEGRAFLYNVAVKKQ